MKEKIYRIEEHTDCHEPRYRYRFCSLYNGTRGTWATKENAIEEGDLHQKIVLALAGYKDTELQIVPRNDLNILQDLIGMASSRLDKIEVSEGKWKYETSDERWNYRIEKRQVLDILDKVKQIIERLET